MMRERINASKGDWETDQFLKKRVTPKKEKQKAGYLRVKDTSID